MEPLVCAAADEGRESSAQTLCRPRHSRDGVDGLYPASTDDTSIRFADRGRMLSKSIKAWIMGSISRWRTPPRGTDRCDLLDSSPSAVLGHEQSPRSAPVAAKTAAIAATTVSGRSSWMKCPLSCAMRNPPCGESSAVRRWISNHRAFRSAVSSCGEPRCPTDALSMSLWHWPALMLGFSLGLWKKCHHDPAERHRSGLRMDDKSVCARQSLGKGEESHEGS